MLGGLALVVISAYAGARLNDTVGTSPPPRVRPAIAAAVLTVRLDPPAAALSVDGADAATVPRDPEGALALSAGPHTLIATLAGRPALERSITLGPGERRALTLTLGPEQGHVELVSDPPGAEVKLGDRSLGVTPTSAELPLDGPLRLRFERRDHAPAERVLRPEELTGGPPRRIKIVQRLEPLPRGQLTLGARPWAHVTIDGERRPDTPVVKLPVTVGAHVIKLSCPATGKDLRFTVQVEAGKETRRVADLTGEPHLVEQ